MKKFGFIALAFICMLTLAAKPASAASKNAGKKAAISWETLCEAVRIGEESIGKPYKRGAKGPDAFDCSGLMRYIFKEAGAPHVYGTSKSLAANEKWIKIERAEDLQPGDLIFSGDGEKVSHVGLYIGGDTLLESTSGGVHFSCLSFHYRLDESFGISPSFFARRLLDGPAPESRVPLKDPSIYRLYADLTAQPQASVWPPMQPALTYSIVEPVVVPPTE